MPIEIKELHIKVNVDEGHSQKNTVPTAEFNAEKEEQIIAKCIKQVLRILKDQQEP